MSRIVIVDFHQVVIASCAAQVDELKNVDTDEAKNMVKHIAITIILGFKKKFRPEKIILACDAKNYWRKEEFEWYKGHRAKIKEKSEFLDWDLIRAIIEEIKIELRENFPYTLIEVDGAEADDVIAILCKYYQENDLVNTGLMDEPREIVICSTDGDFPQLQKLQNVSQWNNVKKQMIVCKNPKQFLIEHIVEGDNGDNIPSIPNGDEWAKARTEGISLRAKPLMKSRMIDFYNKGIDACLDETERRNWLRNQKLIDFDFIPEHINNTVLDAFLRYEVKGNKKKLFNYFIKNQMQLLMGSISEF